MEVSTSVFHVRSVWDYSTPKTNGIGMKWFLIHFLLVLVFMFVNNIYLFHPRLKVVLFSPFPGSVASSHPSLKYYLAFSFYYWTGKVTSADMTSSYKCWHQFEDKISDNNSPACIQLVSGWESEFWDENIGTSFFTVPRIHSSSWDQEELNLQSISEQGSLYAFEQHTPWRMLLGRFSLRSFVNMFLLLFATHFMGQSKKIGFSFLWISLFADFFNTR